MENVKFSEKLFERAKGCYNIAALTGAGISAESGVPTFRGKDGLWKNHDVQRLASPQALQHDPKLFWEFYKWRRELLANVKPNLGHYALVDLEQMFKGFSLITQNVDGLHGAAGSKNLWEIHGNINITRCNECGYQLKDSERGLLNSEVPLCPKCSGVLRPGVVLFGENLSPSVLSAAQEAASQSEIFFSIGTSAVVEPAASLPYIAKANGAYVVEINTERTPLSDHVDEVILGPSGKVLPALVMQLEKYLG